MILSLNSPFDGHNSHIMQLEQTLLRDGMQFELTLSRDGMQIECSHNTVLCAKYSRICGYVHVV